jgi:hypothetical protein
MLTENKTVSWITFVWVVAIVTALMGAIWAMQISNMKSLSELRSDVSVVKNDVSWIRNTLKINELSIK